MGGLELVFLVEGDSGFEIGVGNEVDLGGVDGV